MSAYCSELLIRPDHNGEAIKISEYIYGDKFKDEYLLHNPTSLPRYARLAMKVIRHYAGDNYNPHTVEPAIEIHVRRCIQGLVEYKIMYRTIGYDWDWIDHFFRKMISSYFKIDLPYYLSRIERGFAPEFVPPIVPDLSRPN